MHPGFVSGGFWKRPIGFYTFGRSVDLHLVRPRLLQIALATIQIHLAMHCKRCRSSRRTPAPHAGAELRPLWRRHWPSSWSPTRAGSGELTGQLFGNSALKPDAGTSNGVTRGRVSLGGPAPPSRSSGCCGRARPRYFARVPACFGLARSRLDPCCLQTGSLERGPGRTLGVSQGSEGWRRGAARDRYKKCVRALAFSNTSALFLLKR